MTTKLDGQSFSESSSNCSDFSVEDTLVLVDLETIERLKLENRVTAEQYHIHLAAAKNAVEIVRVEMYKKLEASSTRIAHLERALLLSNGSSPIEVSSSGPPGAVVGGEVPTAWGSTTGARKEILIIDEKLSLCYWLFFFSRFATM